MPARPATFPRTEKIPAPPVAPTPMPDAATTPMDGFLAGFVDALLDLYGAELRLSRLGEQFLLGPTEHRQAVG